MLTKFHYVTLTKMYCINRLILFNYLNKIMLPYALFCSVVWGPSVACKLQGTSLSEVFGEEGPVLAENYIYVTLNKWNCYIK